MKTCRQQTIKRLQVFTSNFLFITGFLLKPEPCNGSETWHTLRNTFTGNNHVDLYYRLPRALGIQSLWKVPVPTPRRGAGAAWPRRFLPEHNRNTQGHALPGSRQQTEAPEPNYTCANLPEISVRIDLPRVVQLHSLFRPIHSLWIQHS